MINQQHTRFKDAKWVKDLNIIVGGAGGIGSWLIYFLCKIGYNVTAFDDDIVELHNLGGQFFKIHHINKPKVSAIKDMLENTNIAYLYSGINHKIEEVQTYGTPYVFSAFDNMQARRILFDSWKNNNKDGIFIDGRLLMENMQIFCVTPERADEYEEYLFNDKEVNDFSCTLRQTSHTAAMIATLMTSFFTNHIANKEGDFRKVPFYHQYSVQSNIINKIK